jgi:hypothetical protein
MWIKTLGVELEFGSKTSAQARPPKFAATFTAQEKRKKNGCPF